MRKPGKGPEPVPARSLEATKNALRHLIEENAGIPAVLIQDDSTIDGDLAMDSMSFVSVQVAIEETFGIRCSPADIEQANSFEALAALIDGRARSARKEPARQQTARGGKGQARTRLGGKKKADRARPRR